MIRCQKKAFSGLNGAREDNKVSDNTDTRTIRVGVTPSGPIGNPPPSNPPLLRRIPFLLQPSQFILAWDRHKNAGLHFPVAWFSIITYCKFIAESKSKNILKFSEHLAKLQAKWLIVLCTLCLGTVLKE